MLSLLVLDQSHSSQCLAQLAALQLKCFSPSWSTNQLKQQFTSQRGLSFALLEAGQLRGFIYYQLLFEQAELLQIGIDPSYHQRGFAEHLLITSLSALKQKSIERVLLEVRESNAAAIKLYQRQLFVLDGRRKNYYPSNSSGTREDALLFSLGLVND